MAREQSFSAEELSLSSLTSNIITLLKIDQDIGGIHIKGKFSPVREQYLRSLKDFFPNKKIMKIYPFQTPNDFGSTINIVQTLVERRPVYQDDFFSNTDKIIFLPMAERIGKSLASFLKTKMEQQPGQIVIALDESSGEENSNDNIHENLSQNLTFYLPFEGIRHEDLSDIKIKFDKIKAAKKKLKCVGVTNNVLQHLISSSELLGVKDSKIIYKTLKVAKAICAYKQRDKVSKEEINIAVSLVMVQKAKRFPEIHEAQEQEQSRQPEQNKDKNSDKKNNGEKELTDEQMLIEAIKANLPKGLIEQIIKNQLQTRQSVESIGSGEKKKDFKFGRPLPSVSRKYSSDKKIDIIATLTKAIPWQKLRKNLHQESTNSLIFYPDDIFIRQFEQKSERVLIFIVDSSGSNAIGRLAEAKGAVELLLSDAYAKRDNVALISFGGTDAKILLPSTKSLVTAKRKLAALPGGGGTPLALGLLEAYNLANLSKSKNIKPILVLLSDGKSNIGLKGEPNRKIAAQDSLKIAAMIRNQGFNTIFIDTARREEQVAKDLAFSMKGKYFPLPRANSHNISEAIKTSI